jgi:hypothetical protein
VVETVEGIHRISEGKITEEWSTLDVRPVWEDLAHEIRERELVEQELREALEIQQASLPKEVPQLEGWQISPHQETILVSGDGIFLCTDGLVEPQLRRRPPCVVPRTRRSP